MSFAILFSETANCFSAMRFYNSIMSGKCFKFIFGRYKGCPVNSAMYFAVTS
jgi:hypothetical protein